MYLVIFSLAEAATVWLLVFSSAATAHLVTAMATTVWLWVLPVGFWIAAAV
jgi:hypothetical protein